MDQMKDVLKLLVKGEKGLAQKAYQKMRDDCLVTAGRKTGDKVKTFPCRLFSETLVCSYKSATGS